MLNAKTKQTKTKVMMGQEQVRLLEYLVVKETLASDVHLHAQVMPWCYPMFRGKTTCCTLNESGACCPLLLLFEPLWLVCRQLQVLSWQHLRRSSLPRPRRTSTFEQRRRRCRGLSLSGRLLLRVAMRAVSCLQP